jgi:hypothetical protein
MANISSINGILCVDIGSVNGNAKADISEFDSIPFCAPTPTPTATPTPSPTPGGPTPTPTPTPTSCELECCPIELCYSVRDCTDACACNNPELFYIHKCVGDDCVIDVAFGIYKDELCTSPGDSGYYSQSAGKCWYWDGTTLVLQGPC